MWQRLISDCTQSSDCAPHVVGRKPLQHCNTLDCPLILNVPNLKHLHHHSIRQSHPLHLPPKKHRPPTRSKSIVDQYKLLLRNLRPSPSPSLHTTESSAHPLPLPLCLCIPLFRLHLCIPLNRLRSLCPDLLLTLSICLLLSTFCSKLPMSVI